MGGIFIYNTYYILFLVWILMAATCRWHGPDCTHYIKGDRKQISFFVLNIGSSLPLVTLAAVYLWLHWQLSTSCFIGSSLQLVTLAAVYQWLHWQQSTSGYTGSSLPVVTLAAQSTIGYTSISLHQQQSIIG